VRLRPRHLYGLAAAGLLVLVAAHAYSAYSASSTVAPGKLGRVSSTVTANNLKPPECTMTVTSIVGGSGNFNATAPFQLVIGSSGKDNVTLLANDCFVGGGPSTGGARDKVTGPNPTPNGDQCVVNSGANVTRCTVVANRP
jgi:hypothetical protein